MIRLLSVVRTFGLLLVCVSVSAALAQSSNGPVLPQLQGLDDLLGTAAPDAGSPLRTSARLLATEDGTQGVLQVAVDLENDWHIYSLTQPAGGPLRTRIVVDDSSGAFRLLTEFQPDQPPLIAPSDVFPVSEEYHVQRVVWSARIEFSSGVDPRQLSVLGHLEGQLCQPAGSCLPLTAQATRFTAEFAGLLPAEFSAEAQESSASSEAGPVLGVAAPSLGTERIAAPQTSAAEASSAGVAAAGTGVVAARDGGWGMATLKKLAIALLAGLILNLMPCVLPVIGLKLMSFAQQAGESAGRVLWLNVAFVGGLLAVFMGLAALAAFLGWGWGQQFQRPEFGIFLVSVVFMFALSFLGVWEIPIPGFVASGTAAELSSREGAAGAFFKGVLTTLLATPCSGPLLVPTLAWALRQPKPLIFATFAAMGLGMGLPYLLFGLFPGVIRWLPKPGAWMDTLKQIMGFVLLATVVWIFTFIDTAYFVPTLALLFTLWAACWWMGRIPYGASLPRKLRSYASAALFASVLGYGAFTWLLPDEEHKWEPFSRATLASYQERGTPVFVQFTADWCASCKTNEAVALKTRATRKYLNSRGIIPLVADLTRQNLEASQMLQELGNEGEGIPFYAIFPGDGRDPVVFSDVPLLQSTLIDKLESAIGPSQTVNVTQSTTRL